MATKLMKCGHAANAHKPTGEPVCAICAGITPKAEEVADEPDLTGRMAHCSYGKHAIRPSSTDLAFFEHRPDCEYDVYYCGCFGWN